MQPFAGTKAKGYVTIDFDKTDALIKSANQRFFEVRSSSLDLQDLIFKILVFKMLIFKIQLFLQTPTCQEDEPGVRKTRHNSSLSDLGVATKLGHKVD